MNPLRKLAGQTAIYGLSSIVGRVLNYLLVPLYTRTYLEHEFGVVTEMYAYVAVLIIVLTYGMETAYFRFSESTGNRGQTFSTAFTSVFITALAFLTLSVTFSSGIADTLDYPNHREYVVWFAMIIAFDAITAIPFARLREENRATYFAAIKLINIGVNIGLNLLFIVVAPWFFRTELGMQFPFHTVRAGVGYIFIANLIASSVTLALLIPVMAGTRLRLNVRLWKKMIVYALPLLILGIAGTVNETIDRIMLKFLLPGSLEERMAQVGIYGACYKISIILSLFIQAFRYAAEPFFFAQEKKSDSRKVYADIMSYFSAVCGLIFLGIMVYMDVIKHFIGSAYHEGLAIVPILLLANIFLGFFYNLSVWYKLREKTLYGAVIALTGAFITLALNYTLIPSMGYMASAWATLACYAFMTFLSYVLGRKEFPVPYEPGRILGYIILAFVLYQLHLRMPEIPTFLTHIANTFFIFVYLFVVIITHKTLKKRMLPKFFR